MEGENSGGFTSAAECVAAGMYWFAQSDLAAAGAWWRRALELDPDNQRAQECLSLLKRTSATGYKHDSWARLPAVPRRPADTIGDEGVFTDTGGQEDSADEDLELALPPSRHLPPFDETVEERRSSNASFPPGGRWDTEPPWASLRERPNSRSAGTLPVDRIRRDAPKSYRALQTTAPPSLGPVTGDMGVLPGQSTWPGAPSELELAAEGGDWVSPEVLVPSRPADEEGTDSLDLVDEDAIDSQSPWDEGPSRTSVVTIEQHNDFDAVVDPTPLPEQDREVFFNRGRSSAEDGEDDGLLFDSDDLPDEAPPALEMNYLSDVMVIEEALSTEPATSVSTASPETALAVARTRYQLHDFLGVVEALDGYPAEAGANTEVRNMLAEAKSQLLRMYEAKIGSLEQIPAVLISNEEVIWLNLNHRAGFILSQVDGTVSYDDLISLSGMPRLDTVQILAELIDQRVIGTDSGKSPGPTSSLGRDWT